MAAPRRDRDAILAVAGLLLALAAVYRAEPFDSLRGTLLPVALVALTTLAANLLGEGLARSLGIAAAAGERVIAGLFLLSLWPVVIGSFGGLSAPLLLLPAAALPLFALKRVGPLLREDAESLLGEFHSGGSFLVALRALVLMAVAWGLLSVLVPPAGLDAPSYHLGLPLQYLLGNSVRPPDTMGYYLYWQQFEMLVLPLVAADSSGIAANLLGFVLFVSLLGAVGRLGGETGSAGRWAAVAVVAASPLVLLLLAYTKNDLFALAGVAAAARVLLRPGREEETSRGSAVWMGLLLGGALAVKPSAAFAALPLFLGALLVLRRNARAQVALVLATALLPAYWIARNLAWTGSSPLPPNIAAMVAPPAWIELLWHRPVHLLLTFLQFHPENIDGPIGGLALLASGLFFVRSRRLPGLRLLVAGSLLLWVFLGNGQGRFLLPLVAVLAAVGAGELALSGRPFRGVILALILLSLVTVVRLQAAYSPFFLVHAGSLSRDAYVTHWVPTFPLQQAASRFLPSTALVASVGEPRLFYLRRPAAWDGYWERPRLLDLAHAHHDPARLARELGNCGFTHVLYNPAEHDPAVSRGGAVAPYCASDTATLQSLLTDSRLATPLMVDPLRPGQGLYRLEFLETVVGAASPVL